MSDRSVKHDTFTIERIYDAPLERVFAAWSDPASKASWFAPDATEHTLDFRVGGIERNRGGGKSDGPLLTFESVYHDIVEGNRIVFGSQLFADDLVVTVSLTTVEFHSDPAGTLQMLTQHNAFLDGHELPEWRKAGTESQLNQLAVEVAPTDDRRDAS